MKGKDNEALKRGGYRNNLYRRMTSWEGKTELENINKTDNEAPKRVEIGKLYQRMTSFK